MVESLMAVQVLGIPGWLIVALAALFTAAVSIWKQRSVAYVLIAPHARNRASGLGIQERDLEYMARLASKKGWGIHGKEKPMRHGTNHRFMFVPLSECREDLHAQASKALEGINVALPVVILTSVMIDERFREDGTPKSPDEPRRWTVKSEDWDDLA